MNRIHLTDEQWAFIQPLLPLPARTGRPWADDRRTIAGIVCILSTGCPEATTSVAKRWQKSHWQNRRSTPFGWPAPAVVRSVDRGSSWRIVGTIVARSALRCVVAALICVSFRSGARQRGDPSEDAQWWRAKKTIGNGIRWNAALPGWVISGHASSAGSVSSPSTGVCLLSPSYCCVCAERLPSRAQSRRDTSREGVEVAVSAARSVHPRWSTNSSGCSWPTRRIRG